MIVILGAGCGRWGYGAQFDHAWTVDVFEDRMAGPATMGSPDELDPGAVGLSLREALVIAGNTPGTDRIGFSPRVFPRSAPITIAPGSPLPEVAGDGTSVDGTGAGVEIDATASAGPLVVITGDDVTVRGLTFRSAGEDVIHLAGGHRVSIEDVTILDPAGRGIVLSSCSGVSILRARIERAGGDLISVTDCTDVTVAEAFMVIGDKDALRGINFLRVTDSRVIDNIIDPGEARLVNLADSSDNLIARNILDRGHAGVVLEGESHGNLVIQNSVISSTYDGVYVSSAATGNTVVHNTLFQCTTPIADGASDTVAANNLVSTEASDFVDPVAYDFRLAPGSPHVDAAEDLGYDCLPDRSERFLGAAPDLGSVESY